MFKSQALRGGLKAAAFALLTLTSFSAFAQTDGTKPKDMDPTARAKHRLVKLDEKLSLSEAQEKAIYPTLLEMAQLRDKARTEMQGAKPDADTKAARKAQVKALTDKIRAQLTEAQKVTFDAMKDDAKEHHKNGKGKGHKRGQAEPDAE